MPQDPILAAGGVLWRPAGRTTSGSPDPLESLDDEDPSATAGSPVEVAVVHRPKYDDWSLPKGKVDPGEHLLETAVREIEEETGVPAVLGRPLGRIRYPVEDGDRLREKEVTYWAARAGTGTFTPHAEIDALEWLDPQAARRRLTRREDETVLDTFLAAPPSTVALIVLRHAQALPRRQWSGDDDDRPLSPAGEAQARALIGLIAAYGVRRVVSSPSARCMQSVVPFAHKAGIEVIGEPALSETGHERDPDAAAATVSRSLAGTTPVLFCSHRPALPTLVSAALAHADEAAWQAASTTAPLKKSEMLVAHAAGARALAVERHRAKSG